MKFAAFFKDGTSIATALVEKKGKEISILNTELFDETKDVYLLRHYIQHIRYTEPQTVFITALDIKEFSLKKAQIPKAKGKELKELLHYELEKHNVFFQEESMTEATLYPSDKDAVLQEVAFVSCSKKTFEKHLYINHVFALNPDVVTTAAHALFRWCQKYLQCDKILVIHLSKVTCRLCFIYERKLEKAHEIILEKAPFDSPQFWQECDKFLFRCFSQKQIQNLDITFLEKELPEKPLLNLLKEYDITGSILACEKAPHAIPIGMCLDEALADQQSIDFTLSYQSKQETFFAKSYKSTLRDCAFRLLAITALAAVVFTSYFSHQEKLLSSKVSSLIEEIVGKEKLAKVSLDKTTVEEKLLFLEKQVVLSKKNLLETPTFSISKILKDFEDVLKKEKIEGRLVNLSYAMLSFPTYESKKTPYEGEVVIEFKTTEPIVLKQSQFPSYFTKFAFEKKLHSYEISFLAKKAH